VSLPSGALSIWEVFILLKWYLKRRVFIYKAKKKTHKSVFALYEYVKFFISGVSGLMLKAV
jgi:hypothetical protein